MHIYNWHWFIITLILIHMHISKYNIASLMGYVLIFVPNNNLYFLIFETLSNNEQNYKLCSLHNLLQLFVSFCFS